MENKLKYKQFEKEIIIFCVRWYLKYPLSYRQMEEIMLERGINVSHTTIMRWTIEYAPKINKNIKHYLRKTNDSWRVDETYVKVKGEWKYLYRAVDSEGQTIDFYLSHNRNKKSAKAFFDKALSNEHVHIPRVC